MHGMDSNVDIHENTDMALDPNINKDINMDKTKTHTNIDINVNANKHKIEIHKDVNMEQKSNTDTNININTSAHGGIRTSANVDINKKTCRQIHT